MSEPFIIWTMRRTGGTTLADLLGILSEYPKDSHEPFNPDRAYGAIVKGWLEDRDDAVLYRKITNALKRRPVIKHCYELMAPTVNECLMRVANEKGYRHIILDRRAEDDRIVSLELAKITGAWGGQDTKAVYAQIKDGSLKPDPINIQEGVQHLLYCQKRREELSELMARHGQTPFVVYFEDVYADPEKGRALVRRIVDFLGMNPADHAEYGKMVDEALLTRGQNSAQILEAVPNGTALRDRLQVMVRGAPAHFTAS